MYPSAQELRTRVCLRVFACVCMSLFACCTARFLPTRGIEVSQHNLESTLLGSAASGPLRAVQLIVDQLAIRGVDVHGEVPPIEHHRASAWLCSAIRQVGLVVVFRYCLANARPRAYPRARTRTHTHTHAHTYTLHTRTHTHFTGLQGLSKRPFRRYLLHVRASGARRTRHCHDVQRGGDLAASQPQHRHV